MKKILLILLIVTTLIFSSCSAPVTSNESAENKTTDTIEQTKNTTEVDTSNVEQENKKEEEPIDIEKQIIYETENIKITAKNINFDSIFGPELNLLVENKSDQNLIAQIENSSINDVMISNIFSCDVAAGKKANDSISFMSNKYQHFDPKTIATIEFEINVMNSDSYDRISESEKIILKTNIFELFSQEHYDNGTIILDSNNIKIFSKKVIDEDSIWGSELVLYIENNSENDIVVQTSDVSINGFMLQPMFSSNICSHKKAYDTVTFFESDLEENEIENISEIELNFIISEEDSYKTLFESDIINIQF